MLKTEKACAAIVGFELRKDALDFLTAVPVSSTASHKFIRRFTVANRKAIIHFTEQLNF